MSTFRPAALLTLLTLAACGGGIHKRWTFDQAFPDPNELVTTPDPEAAHSRLVETELPRTRAHDDRLLALLRAQAGITAAHLALLTQAVGTENTHTVYDGKNRFVWGRRGAGEAAATVELLLLEGLPKITTIDRRWYGELLGRSQTNATLQRYLDRFHDQFDDGSVTALLEILAGMPGSPALTPFVLALRKAGKADDARTWLVFEHLSFDDNRIELVRAVTEQGLRVDPERLRAAVKQCSFDQGRATMLALLAPKTQALQVADVAALVGMFSFDDGRVAACAQMAKSPELHFTEADLATLLAEFSFDDGRRRCIEHLAPTLHGPATLASARAILKRFSFDEDRVAATRLMASRWLQLSKDDRTALVDALSFESNRQRALVLLMP